ncbi:MAG: hypothetical protein PVF70_12400, partial [Anaerolineales bacterium]
ETGETPAASASSLTVHLLRERRVRSMISRVSEGILAQSIAWGGGGVNISYFYHEKYHLPWLSANISDIYHKY